MESLFKSLAGLPLPLLHGLGAALGWLAYMLSPTYRRRFATNSRLAGYTPSQVRGSVAHAGRMVAELPRLWWGAPVPIQWDGVSLIDEAHASGKGIVFLTPHLGCFEVTAQAYAQRYAPQGKAITVLYRPARKAWLQSLMSQSRHRSGLTAAPATLAGVKTLVKALRSGQALGILPDQVPPLGLGVWSSFFGQPAYSMTLPARLVKQTGATILLAWGERLPGGKGYCVHLRPFAKELSDTPEQSAAQINAAMESLVRECPKQYLWGYARYKQPRADDMLSPPGSL
ncbi:lysophospholipid acyltransferase family protein [Variovorax sp. PCZ-1]|uniref:lysophospholipid acyltransferase family protein n=1 Tax=Variovorax sp. PCZ-1 TaxID=2835533 RepID=UPI001BD0B1EF|nr:lysophospholipid acyltransferase family protein [Variovorax sp. PCZ-1]MBS7808176.1 lysophospholipid acyltransferase family protein [Variovorax sp. PCZ-1]